MSSKRVEYVMVGTFVEKLPFNGYDEKYRPWFWNLNKKSLHIVRLGDCDGSDLGFVMGRILVRSVSECACSVLSEIPKDTSVDFVQVQEELKDKLGMDIAAKEIKYYTFTVWE